MRELLVIAYLFPPLGGGGVQRTLGFVRHLPKNGWRPTVICADDDAAYWARDPSLVQRVPIEATVVRVPGGWSGALVRGVRRVVPRALRRNFDDFVFIPDRQAPWMVPAMQAALRVAEDGRFAALYSTGSPWTNHLVAASVQARTGLPWIADFRDPWTKNMTFAPATGAHAAVHRRLEHLVYRRANRIVANTPGHMRSVVNDFAASASKTTFIPNGYAESDFAKRRPAPSKSGPLLLGYAGSFYPGQGPEALLDLLAAARDRSPPFRVRFMGNTGLAERARAVGLDDIVEELGYLPQSTMLDRLSECHATIVTVPAHPRPNGVVPQKLYMYLRLGRPIIGLLPPGDAADLVREAGEQHLLQDPAVMEAGEAAEWLHELARGHVGEIPSDAFVVQRHARDVLTQRLAGLLNEIAK